MDSNTAIASEFQDTCHLLAIYFYNKLKEMFKWMSIISNFRNSSSSTVTNKKK